MADEKEKVTPFFTQEKVTLYAPIGKDVPHFKRGEKTVVQARQKAHFLKKGFTNEAPKVPATKEPAEPKADGAKTMTNQN